jgi:hypothetical protein
MKRRVTSVLAFPLEYALKIEITRQRDIDDFSSGRLVHWYIIKSTDKSKIQRNIARIAEMQKLMALRIGDFYAKS